MDEEKGVDTVYGKVCIRKQQKLRRKILVREQLEDFASNTTLHGLGYIARRDITTIEKVFWLIAFCVSVCVCFYQISNVWWKWNNSPVIVTINDELISVSQVPFPSITICPQIKIQTKSYNYTHERSKLLVGNDISAINMTDEKRKIFEDVSLLCDKGIFDYNVPFLKRNHSNSDVIQNIIKATKDNLLWMIFRGRYTWQQELYSMLQSWSQVVTKDGICYNFNSLPADDVFREDVNLRNVVYNGDRRRIKNWSLEKGYVEGMPNETYPRRGRENGAECDLTMFLSYHLNEMDTECNVLYSGYKVFIQHPADMPQATIYSYALLPQQTSSVALRFTMMKTSPALKKYTHEKRRCYFPDERYLRYFKIYTENNCRIECLSNYTFNKCDCVAFYMPRETSDKICTIQQRPCMESAIEKMAAGESPGLHWDPEKCNCLPPCDKVEYDAEILKTEFNFKQYMEKIVKKYFLIDSSSPWSEHYDASKVASSRLEMYFKSPRFLSMRRSELFGTTDFIANCGGLLGLFLGFSFLSLLEIIYFASLRLWCTFKCDLKAGKNKT